jgi:hypothetical protein
MKRTPEILAVLAAVLIGASASAAFAQTSDGPAGSGVSGDAAGVGTASPAGGGGTPRSHDIMPDRPGTAGPSGTTGSGSDGRIDPTTGRPCTGTTLSTPTPGTSQPQNPTIATGGC